MADATLARSDDASRNEELRASDIAALRGLIGGADHYCMKVEREQSRSFYGFKSIYQKSYDALCEGHLKLLQAIPDGSDRDIVILAGHASLMADQIQTADVTDRAFIARLVEGVQAALISISGSIGNRFPEQVEEVATLWPELGQSIRNDMTVARQMISEMEGR
jgi:hypothetical protein